MPINKFTAFYPSKPFWAGSKVDFGNKSYEGWFHDQMIEEVFSHEMDAYSLKLCRDGRIMLRISALENEQSSEGQFLIKEMVRRWGEYLDYLNAFYLLLDSSSIEIGGTSHFNIHEITNRDAFRVIYEGGKSTGEGISSESIASVFQLGRFSSSYSSGIPIENDSRIIARQIISLDIIDHAAKQFAKVVASPGLQRTLASFAKSLSEYKIGNYKTSVILSWFITEEAIGYLWKAHIEDLNCEFKDGKKRINQDRRKFLTGQDVSISLVSNLLELWDVLPSPLFQDIDSVRRSRNRIVHGYNFMPSPEDAELAMQTAQSLIDRYWGFSFALSMGYSVSGL